MITKVIRPVYWMYGLVDAAIRSIVIVPIAFLEFCNGMTIDEFCGRVDPLTKLFNKRGLEKHLARRKGCVGVLFLDVDCFKAVNDTFGHHVGDHYLIKIASTVQDAVDGHARVYRIGGDEMLVLANEGIDIDSLEYQLRAYLKSKLGIPISIGKSVGDPQSVVKLADARMYREKRKKHAVPLTGDMRGMVFSHSAHDRRSSLSRDRRISSILNHFN